MTVSAADISSADATAIIDGALLDAQTGSGNDVSPAPATTPDNTSLLPSVSLSKEEEQQSEEHGKKQLAAFQDEAKIQKAQEDMLGKEAADALRKEQADKKAKEKTLLGIAEKYLDKGKSTASNANIKIGNVPTPGSIGVPLTILAIFFFILVSYAGKSRLQWLWYVLTNNAYVTASQQTTTTTPSGSGPNFIPLVPEVVTVPTHDNSRYSSNGMYGSPY